MESNHISVQGKIQVQEQEWYNNEGLLESKQRFIENLIKIRLLKFSVILICLTFPLIAFWHYCMWLLPRTFVHQLY